MQVHVSMPLSIWLSSLLSVTVCSSAAPDWSKAVKEAPAASAMGAPLDSGSSFPGFGWLFPDAHARSSSNLEVVPGGQSIGIKLHAAGILVVGYHLVHQGKEAFSPGEKASVHVGDLIVAVSGQTVKSVEEVARLIDRAGQEHQMLKLGIRRKGQSLQFKVTPVLDEDSGMYRLGLFIRDSASGVGTLTFYDPNHRAFGALGHVIADIDTGEAIVGQGQIVHAAVTSIDRGESGQPGEKRGLFVNEKRVLGTIVQNTEFGVFGYMKATPDYGLYNKPIPVASPRDVHPGSAKMLTVVGGQRVQAFDVKIVRANPQTTADVKGLVIRITDPVLLSKTGGIVQGMSGSPILQDGKLVGAVTHVFVSDPTQGYGIYAEWMVRGFLQHARANSHHAS